MPKYERYGDDHEVVETVVTVADSPNDKRLSASKVWKRVDDDASASAAPGPAPEAKSVRASAKPPAKEG
jgi:hypothetical protein